MSNYIVLAFRVSNVGNNDNPDWIRVGEFLTLQRLSKGNLKNWSPEFGKPIPPELILNQRGEEKYFFVREPEDRVADLLDLIQHLETKIGLEQPLLSRLADFCIDILDPALGPVAAP